MGKNDCYRTVCYTLYVDMPLAPYIRKYFWDIDPKTARPKAHPEYFITRILEMGDKKSISWIKFVFGKRKIKEVLKKARISQKSKNYWLHNF